MEQNKEHKGLINTAILKGAEKLGVTLKDKQYESINIYVGAKMCLAHCPLGMANQLYMQSSHQFSAISKVI